ncbi:MAG: 2,3,4,5-tetrahydropyridine-2,6-dicarboxylate N-succinyltransferase [Holosporales bacterium]|jgi:2,3,4,5-tetrahydropyridine-2-carboxylate N-succinyltransferase|nr:2,3,4,5-tetrahydropyridine-2,6-dicarboxylate N-succinyltransferase [Holosporales bacterium]
MFASTKKDVHCYEDVLSSPKSTLEKSLSELNLNEAKSIINGAPLDVLEAIDFQNNSELKLAVKSCIDGLDRGEWRIAECKNGAWTVNDFLKRAILLYFRAQDNYVLEFSKDRAGPVFWDKIPLKTTGWSEYDFKKSGFRVVAGAVVRYGAFIGPSSVIMPSFINIGAYVGRDTMVDAWATVGSCAQIGNRCHISDGVTIGGVLEPIQASPVIIEDDCFIGARSSISEGVKIGRGSVLASGVSISASTKIVDRETGAVTYGFVPSYSVVVQGSIATATSGGKTLLSASCALIVKHVDEQTRTKTAINEILRW